MNINHPTGTRVSYKPGVITGGEHTHDCGLQRSIGYYLEPLVLLAPFAKKPCIITLRGVTNDDKDLSVGIIVSWCQNSNKNAQVDTFRTITLPLLRHFGVEEGIELKVPDSLPCFFADLISYKDTTKRSTA